MVNFSDIQEARERIASIAQRTPVMTSRGFDREAGAQAFFKCENLQRGGAFKIRGAANLIFSIPKSDLPRGVVAFSSGNHAQAVAIAAREIGAKATLVMPEDAPRFKMEATRAQGPVIVTYNRHTDDREALGKRVAEQTGATLIPPYDHDLIMAGQGTVAAELLEDVPDLDALAICIGGGGLVSGCAIAAKAINPSIRVFGVEPELANDSWLSFQEGRRVGIAPPNTIADGLRSPMPGELTFPVMRQHLESIILVTEDEIRATVRFFLLRMKILVEPSGAVAAAAVLFRKLPPNLKRIGVVISGGNVDPEQVAEILGS